MRVTVLLAWAAASCAIAAEPVVELPPCQPPPEAVVAALNALRAQPQQCGARRVAASGPLRWHGALAESSHRYALNLARRDRIDHVGEPGSSLRARLRDAGYAMKQAGENLAGGPDTLEEALAGWLASPAHCENLMAPEFQEVGLACVTGPGHWQQYWVLHLAAPRVVREPARSSPDQSP